MHLEEFAAGKSIWHRMDPRAKIVGLTVFAVVTAFCKAGEPLYLALFLGVIALLSARLDAKKVLFRLMVVNTFVLFLWLFLPFTTPGEPLKLWGFLPVKREGLELAFAITLKTNAIVTATIAHYGKCKRMPPLGCRNKKCTSGSYLISQLLINALYIIEVFLIGLELF